ALLAAACASSATARFPAERSDLDRRFEGLRESYFLKLLSLYPVVATYLGGDGYSASLSEVNGRLRDWSKTGVAAELAYLKALRGDLATIPAGGLLVGNHIDHAVVSAQVAFLLHMLEDKRWQERAIETYAQEPFRGIDFHIQQMAELGGGLRGDKRD